MGAERPKVGVAFFAARWFDEVVLGKDESTQSFKSFLQKESERVLKRMAANIDLVTCPLITSIERARGAASRFLAEDVDALLLIFLVWSEDEYLLPLRDVMAVRPTILWVSTPYKRPPQKSTIMELFVNSGIVGSFEAFGVLKRAFREKRPFFVFGSALDDEPYREIERVVRAALVRKSLRTTRLGLLPYRNPQMIVTYVDEFSLFSEVGPAVEYVSVGQLKKVADAIPGPAVDEFTKKIRSQCIVDARISEDNLVASARAGLGMERLLFDMGLDGLALSDLNPELHEVMGLRPCLYPERLAHSDKVVGNEGDLGGTTAMVILRKLTGKPIMFTEIFNYDEEKNTVLAGHAGPANYLLSEGTRPVSITPDYELKDSPANIGGVWMEFIAKPGQVTMLNFFQSRHPDPRGEVSAREGGGFQMTIVSGESLGGDLRVEGYPHSAVKLDPTLTDFLRSCAVNGTSHHWAIVHGDVRAELRFIGEMLKIRTITVE